MSDSIPDRVVFARSSDGSRELVRYDRQGRWFLEGVPLKTGPAKMRLGTVHEAVRVALNLESGGGEILVGQPGGKQFDAKVAGGRRRAGKR